VFAASEAKGFLLAGAHRDANGQGTADVAHLEQSIFQEVHQSFTDSASDLSVWQVHGFDGLDGDFTSYAFNTLDTADALNVAVNEDFAGTVFSSLGGTTNIQRQHTTSIGGEFVHIELEQSFRIDGGEASRLLISQSIADAIVASTIAVPEPSSFALVGLFGACFALRRRR